MSELTINFFSLCIKSSTLTVLYEVYDKSICNILLFAFVFVYLSISLYKSVCFKTVLLCGFNFWPHDLYMSQLMERGTSGIDDRTTDVTSSSRHTTLFENLTITKAPGGGMFGDVNISAILDSFSLSYDKRVRPNYGAAVLHNNCLSQNSDALDGRDHSNVRLEVVNKIFKEFAKVNVEIIPEHDLNRSSSLAKLCTTNILIYIRSDLILFLSELGYFFAVFGDNRCVHSGYFTSNLIDRFRIHKNVIACCCTFE
ncbi:hypothetical protein QTP88_005114 [Uroleucon formosanum]